jgi:hypothetical protein
MLKGTSAEPSGLRNPGIPDWRSTTGCRPSLRPVRIEGNDHGRDMSPRLPRRAIARFTCNNPTRVKDYGSTRAKRRFLLLPSSEAGLLSSMLHRPLPIELLSFLPHSSTQIRATFSGRVGSHILKRGGGSLGNTLRVHEHRKHARKELAAMQGRKKLHLRDGARG